MQEKQRIKEWVEEKERVVRTRKEDPKFLLSSIMIIKFSTNYKMSLVIYIFNIRQNIHNQSNDMAFEINSL